MGRYAALSLPFLALAACGDDGGGGSSTAPPARNHGEVVVSFTIQDGATSGLSARSFEINVGTGNSAMLLTDADVTVQTPSGTAIAANSTLSAMDVIVVTFTSPSGELTRDELDYEVDLSGRDRGGLRIDGAAATSSEASSFLASAGAALAREDYKTTGPVFEAGTIDSRDNSILTLTFNEDLRAGPVQADDFTIIDSDGFLASVQDARLVDGQADEVRLKLFRDLPTDSGDVVIKADSVQNTDNIGNAAHPERITPSDDVTLGSTIGATTNVEVPYATAEQKIITPDTAQEPNFLFAASYAEGNFRVQIGTGGQGTTPTEIARSILGLRTDPGETRNPARFVESENFEIHDAVFMLDGVEVKAGTGDMELLGPLSGSRGDRRGDFNAVLVTIDSRTREGSADAPVDLYGSAVEDAYALPDGTPIDSNDLTFDFLGADLVAGV